MEKLKYQLHPTYQSASFHLYECQITMPITHYETQKTIKPKLIHAIVKDAISLYNISHAINHRLYMHYSSNSEVQTNRIITIKISNEKHPILELYSNGKKKFGGYLL